MYQPNHETPYEDIVAGTGVFITTIASYLTIDAEPASEIRASKLEATLLRLSRPRQQELSPTGRAILEQYVVLLCEAVQRMKSLADTSDTSIWDE